MGDPAGFNGIGQSSYNVGLADKISKSMRPPTPI
jgi:hypothetical protein